MNFTIIALIFIVLAGVIAWQKGYSLSLWLLSAGPLGLLILIFALPDIGKISNPEEKIRKAFIGNRIGAILSMLPLFALTLNMFLQSQDYDGNILGSIVWLLILTGFVSAGIAGNLITFKNRFTEAIGCFAILIFLLILLFITALITGGIFSLIK